MSNYFYGINLNKISEIGQVKLANALRKFLNFGKKLTVIAFKRMGNGALWLCYLIDRIKCSTFISAANLETLLSGHTSAAVIPYIEAVINAFHKDDFITDIDYAMSSIKVTVRSVTRHSANTCYRISYSDMHQAWVACLPRSGNAVMKAETVRLLLAAIVKGCR